MLVFCRMPLSGDLCDVFFMIRLALWVWRRNATKVKCHFRHITTRLHSLSWLIPVDFVFGQLAEAGIVRSLYCTVPHLLPFNTDHLGGKKVTIYSLYLKEWRVIWPTSWWVDYLHKIFLIGLCRRCVSSSPLTWSFILT